MSDQSLELSLDTTSYSSDSTITSSKRTGPSDTESEASHPRKKRLVTTTTVEKWIAESDKTLNTISWLQYEIADRSYVFSLKCSKCAQFSSQLEGVRNFSRAFIEGSLNLHVSAFKDHARSDMHKRAMHLFRKSQSKRIVEYSPIAR